MTPCTSEASLSRFSSCKDAASICALCRDVTKSLHHHHNYKSCPLMTPTASAESLMRFMNFIDDCRSFPAISTHSSYCDRLMATTRRALSTPGFAEKTDAVTRVATSNPEFASIAVSFSTAGPLFAGDVAELRTVTFSMCRFLSQSQKGNCFGCVSNLFAICRKFFVPTFSLTLNLSEQFCCTFLVFTFSAKIAPHLYAVIILPYFKFFSC